MAHHEIDGLMNGFFFLFGNISFFACSRIVERNSLSGKTRQPTDLLSPRKTRRIRAGDKRLISVSTKSCDRNSRHREQFRTLRAGFLQNGTKLDQQVRVIYFQYKTEINRPEISESTYNRPSRALSQNVRRLNTRLAQYFLPISSVPPTPRAAKSIGCALCKCTHGTKEVPWPSTVLHSQILLYLVCAIIHTASHGQPN